MVRVVGMNSRRGAPMDMDIAAAVWMTRLTGSNIRSIGLRLMRSPTPRNTCIR